MIARGCALVALLVVAACADKPGSTSAPSSAPESSQPAARDDRGRASLSGALRAHDGSALRRASYSVRRLDFTEPVAEGELDAEGAFRVALPPGLYTVSVSAVDHAQAWRNVLVEDEIRVTGKLGTYARADSGATLKVNGQFVDAQGEPIAPIPRVAKQIEGQRYRLDLGKIPPGTATIRTQIVIDDSRTANAPGGRSYESDGGGDYWAIVDVPKDGALVLDLGKLPPPGQAPQLQWQGEDALTAALQAQQSAWERERSRILESMPRKDGQILVATEAAKATMDQLVAKTRKDVDAEPDERTRLLLRALHALTFSGMKPPGQQREELRWFIEHVPVDEPRLGLSLNFASLFFAGMTDADAELLQATEAWLERFAREQPEPGLAIQAVMILLDRANESADEAGVAELYALAQEKRFAGTFVREHIAREYAPDRVLRRGNRLPEFDFAALGDPTKRVTKRERAGRIYLVEFWATWCGPCVAEMPKLHATYAAINGAKRSKGKGEAGLRKLRPVRTPKVEFVFVSLDGGEADVADFRAKHWSMPWTHAFVGGGLDETVLKQFGFSGVPTAILIDENGNIVEYGEALRNDRLLPTLQRAIAASANASQ